MQITDFFRIIQEDIHSTVIATVDNNKQRKRLMKNIYKIKIMKTAYLHEIKIIAYKNNT